jgi:nitrogen fixation/metabolism regulation signal transduction histidine kinase
MMFFLWQIICVVIFVDMFAILSNYHPNLFYTSWYIIVNIFMVIFITLIIIGKKKATKIYGTNREVKHKRVKPLK